MKIIEVRVISMMKCFLTDEKEKDVVEYYKQDNDE